MSFLDKLIKKTSHTSSGEEIDRLLAEGMSVIAKSRAHRDEDEDEEEEVKKSRKEEKEEPSCKHAHMCKSFSAQEDTEDEERKCEKAGSCEDFEKPEDKSRKSKKDVKPLLGDEEDEGIDEDDIDDEPEDEEDEKAEKKATKSQKKVAEEAKKSRKSKEDIQGAIKSSQKDVYFDPDEDDLPDEDLDIPEEEGRQKGIITNQGRRVAEKAKKSRAEEDPMTDVVDLLGHVALLLDQSLKQNERMTKSMLVMMKSQQKINADMELVKSQTPGYPMAPVMFAPSVRKKASKEEYRPNQVRDALQKGMMNGMVEAELVRDFDAFVGRPGVSVTEWVEDQLSENLRKALSL